MMKKLLFGTLTVTVFGLKPSCKFSCAVSMSRQHASCKLTNTASEGSWFKSASVGSHKRLVRAAILILLMEEFAAISGYSCMSRELAQGRIADRPVSEFSQPPQSRYH